MKIITDLKPHLRQMGCPVTERRERAIEQFISTAHPDICDHDLLVDQAISQRLLPLIGRNLFRAGAKKAFENIEKIIENSDLNLRDSRTLVSELKESDFDGFQG